MEAGTSGFLSISDSDRRVPAGLGQESQSSSCLSNGTLLALPSIFPSIKVFSSKSVLHVRWPKYWSFSFSINSSNEYSELISLRIDWFDLLLSKRLKSLFQHHSSKASILRRLAFFTVQLLHPYMTTGKTIALTRRTFVVSGLD